MLQEIKLGASLTQAIEAAHHAIVSEIKGDEKKRGMATTIVVALFSGSDYDLAWVGDSRAYLWNDSLKLITRDDSYVELLLEGGHIGLKELETHPDRNVISQALGIERKKLSVHRNSGTLLPKQILLICSDGLYGVVKEHGIIQSIANSNEISQLTQKLVDSAVENQGKDNITLISIKNEESNPTDDIKYPTIYREFDVLTGNVIGLEISDVKIEESNKKIEEKDPELVDQTTYKELTEDEYNLIENAAIQATQKKQTTSGYLVPVMMVAILALLFILLYLK